MQNYYLISIYFGFIAFQTIVPLPETVQTTFIATLGDKVILHCPTQPGALLNYYSVIWLKDNVAIAEVRNLHSIIGTIHSQYSINMTSYSLVIDDANVNDSSNNYQCDLSVTIPRTNSHPQLQPSQGRISLTLQVNGKMLDVYL